VRAGDLLPVSAPDNAFELDPKASRFIFIAGGIGITPILSMVRHLRSTGRGDFKLYYLSVSPETTAFLSELQNLKGQAVIHHDGGDPARLFDLWPVLEKPGPAHIYCCGPRPLMDAVRDMTGHWSPAHIHFESFLDSTSTLKPEDQKFRLRLARSGKILEVDKNQTILEALRAAGHDIPSSCESGTCGTCRTRLLAGEAEHRDLILSDADQAHNIMVCVSRARSEELVLDL
jgi:phthalate 4,5-dioxygenase reductase component